VPLLGGRDFTTSDESGAPRVAIVNEAFARKFNLGRQVVGKRMSVGNDSLNIEIVALAKDSKYSSVKDKIPPVYVIPYRQAGRVSSLVYYVRSSLPTDQVVRGIRDISKRIDPNLPLEDFKTMPQQVRENVFLDRMITTMSASFAALATLLAAIGLYGVLAYSVAQRTREIGVRLALGALPAQLRRGVIGQGLRLVFIGGACGVALAFWAGHLVQARLYGVQPGDPVSFALSAGVLALFALVACWAPARRAMRVDPVVALRES